MTLDELIKQADNPTPEYIKELNKQVHEKFTICNNDHKWSELSTFAGWTCHKCLNCGIKYSAPEGDAPLLKEHIQIPDYTKPENFWPLVEWMRNEVYVVEFLPTDQVRVTRVDFNFLIYALTGTAVCLAYLKTKEQESKSLQGKG